MSEDANTVARDEERNRAGMPKAVIWLGALLGALIIAWSTDVTKLLVPPSVVADLATPPLLTTVVLAPDMNSHIALATVPTALPDRAVFLRGKLSDPDFVEVAARHDAAWIQHLNLRVVFEAARDSVRVMDVRIKRTRQGRPEPTLTAVFVERESERVETNVALVADLGAPRARFATPGRPGTPYFGRHSFPLTRGGQTELLLGTVAKTGTHEFVLQVDYLIGRNTKVETLTVTDAGGRPFRVTGVPREYTGYQRMYRNTGSGLRPVQGVAACRLFDLVGRC
jgi:hypothetical protein